MKTWLIWSNEHKAWWRNASAGYTKSRNEAGRYPEAEAVGICHDANRYRDDKQEPNETMVLDL